MHLVSTLLFRWWFISDSFFFFKVFDLKLKLVLSVDEEVFKSV